MGTFSNRGSERGATAEERAALADQERATGSQTGGTYTGGTHVGGSHTGDHTAAPPGPTHRDHAVGNDTERDTHSREHVHEQRVDERDAVTNHDRAHERFGGVNLGAAVAGWLVAIALTVLLSSILGAIASAVGTATELTQDQAQREAGTIGLAAAIAVVVVMMLAYYFGGYVAGRMSRFDGARQGLTVWLIGLLITIVAVILGVVFGDQYNVLDRVDLPRIPIPTDTATWGGIITGVALLLGTLVAAVAGGKVGHRYHDRVDRVAYR